MINKMHKELFLFVSICYVLVIVSEGGGKEKTGWKERQVRETINPEKNKTVIHPSTLRS